MILNETGNYDVTGMFFVRRERNGIRQWTPNQFARPLPPGALFYAAKTGKAGMCRVPYRLVLRDKRTGEQLEVEDVTALCRKDEASMVLRVNVVQPQVTVIDQ